MIGNKARVSLLPSLFNIVLETEASTIGSAPPPKVPKGIQIGKKEIKLFAETLLST